MREDDRDRAVDRLLRDTLRAQTATSASGACVDGEMLAAWTSGSLLAERARDVERHLSDCERCQAVLAAFVRSTSDEPEVHPFWWRGRLQWFVPLATAATAAAIWFAIPVASPTPPVPDQAGERARAKPAAHEPVDRLAKQAPAAQTLETPSESLAPADVPGRVGEERQEAASRENRLDGARSLGRQAAADSAKDTVTVTQERSATGLLDTTAIEIPGSGARWRIRAGRQVERSTTDGSAWEAATVSPPPSDVLTAGFSVSPTICWLVGRRGAVYITTDGMTFVRVSFPEAVDLVAVNATDDRSATVTAADGRAWRTTDQGRVWTIVR